jgi:hypothetical protein
MHILEAQEPYAERSQRRDTRPRAMVWWHEAQTSVADLGSVSKPAAMAVFAFCPYRRGF